MYNCASCNTSCTYLINQFSFIYFYFHLYCIFSMFLNFICKMIPMHELHQLIDHTRLKFVLSQSHRLEDHGDGGCIPGNLIWVPCFLHVALCWCAKNCSARQFMSRFCREGWNLPVPAFWLFFFFFFFLKC